MNNWSEKRLYSKDHRRVFAFFERPYITRINLIYHVCPLIKNDVWRDNLAQLKKRWGIFTGKKVLAVSNNTDLVWPIEEVVKELNRECELFEVPNDANLRETISFKQLLKSVESLDGEEITFYGHTKGNSTKESMLGSEFWRNAMYHYLLDNINAVLDNFRTFPTIGTHKICWPPGVRTPFPTNLDNEHHWMFSGTFFWFNNKAVFSNPKCYEYIAKDRYGVEAWIGNLFPEKQGCTLYQPWVLHKFPPCNPYDPSVHTQPIRG